MDVKTKFKAGEQRSYTLPTKEADNFVNRVVNGPDRRKISSIATSSRAGEKIVTITYARDGNQSAFPTYSRQEAQRVLSKICASPAREKISSAAIDSAGHLSVSWRK